MDESVEKDIVENSEEIAEPETDYEVEAVIKERKQVAKQEATKVQSQLSEYEMFDSESDEPILVTDQDKSAWIGTPKVKNKIIDARDVLTKDLRMSFIDKELAFIMGLWLEASEEWNNHGLHRLSNRRLVALVGHLSLFSSVEGKERIMQGEPSINFDTSMNELRSMRSDSPTQDEQGNKKKSMFGMGR
jgi:hypothetical protein